MLVFLWANQTLTYWRYAGDWISTYPYHGARYPHSYNHHDISHLPYKVSTLLSLLSHLNYFFWMTITFSQQPDVLPQSMYNPRLDRMEGVHPPAPHTAQPYEPHRPSNKKHTRHSRSSSSPQTKLSQKRSGNKHTSKEKSKSSRAKTKNKKKEKPQRSMDSVLPDFIPIQHMTAMHQMQPSEYGPTRGSHSVHTGRARPGVGVMFNPETGVTDF